MAVGTVLALGFMMIVVACDVSRVEPARVKLTGEVTEPLPAARSARRLYSRYCASCHGRDGRAKTAKGKFNHARDVADPGWQDEVGDERIFNSIMNGRQVRGNMPAFGRKLLEPEIDSLVTYVRGLRK